MRQKLFLCLVVLLCYISATGQNDGSLVDRAFSFPSRFLENIYKKAEKIQNKIINDTEKYLKKLQAQEEKLQRKLRKIDSVAANDIFRNIEQRYTSLNSKLITNADGITPLASNNLPFFDTLKTSLSFLQEDNSILSKINLGQSELSKTFSQVKQLNEKLKAGEDIRDILKQRQEYLMSQLQKFGFATQLKTYTKQAYYYAQKLDGYREIINDPEKIQQQAIACLKRIPAFQKYIDRYSDFAALIQSQNSFSSISTNGLQTRQQVTQGLSQNLRGGAGIDIQQLIGNSMQMAQTRLDNLKDKLTKAGGMNTGGGEMPNLKPNTEKAKTFLKRLEYGTNFQTQKSNSFFPATTDLGLYIGYKINQNSIIGVGSSFKMGLGENFRNIKFSAEGLSVRSFVDMKLKGSFFVSGGYEYNYQQPLPNRPLPQFREASPWTQSGLLGISKIISLNNKFFKKTKVQLFWDFLGRYQTPQTQQLKFRVGYNF